MKDTPLDLPAFLPYRLAVAANRISTDLARLYADRFGLSIPEWRVMAILGRFPGLSANAVAAQSAMDKVQVSRAVAGMIAKNLLIRETATDDRRRSALSLSDAGSDIYRQIVPEAQAYERHLLSKLTETEQDLLVSALSRLVEDTD